MHPCTTEPHKSQLCDSAALNPITPLVKAAVDEAIAALDEKTLPVRQRFLRVDAASRFIGVDRVTMAEWRSKGVGPKFRRIGARIVYGVQHLIEFVEGHPLVGTGSLRGESHGNN